MIMIGVCIVFAILSVTVAVAMIGNDVVENLESISSHLDRIVRAVEHSEDPDVVSAHSPDVIDGKERKGDAIHHSGGLRL